MRTVRDIYRHDNEDGTFTFSISIPPLPPVHTTADIPDELLPAQCEAFSKVMWKVGAGEVAFIDSLDEHG